MVTGRMNFETAEVLAGCMQVFTCPLEDPGSFTMDYLLSLEVELRAPVKVGFASAGVK